MKIEINDEMLAAVDAFEKELSNPVTTETAVAAYNDARSNVLSRLLVLIEIERAVERVAG